jgi:hypothetical protein
MAAEQLVGASGDVVIGPLTLVVQELPVAGEVALLKRLRLLAKAALGPGSFYAAAQPTLKWLADQGLHADRAAVLESVARLIATKAAVSDDAADEFRQTPDGVAEELYFRTRRTHPEATLAELRAVVNEANAVEVHLAILEALAPRGKAETGTTRSG